MRNTEERFLLKLLASDLVAALLKSPSISKNIENLEALAFLKIKSTFEKAQTKYPGAQETKTEL